jgi:hypothetical protein
VSISFDFSLRKLFCGQLKRVIRSKIWKEEHGEEIQENTFNEVVHTKVSSNVSPGSEPHIIASEKADI